MAGEETKDVEKPKLKTQKSVQIVDTGPQIVGVREKHGAMYNSIPKMPVPVAVLCCIFNIVAPGLGTFISAFTVLCGCQTVMDKKVPAFLLNIVAAFLQMVTFILIVGWVWSILWGMNMVSMAISVTCDQYYQGICVESKQGTLTRHHKEAKLGCVWVWVFIVMATYCTKCF